MMPSIRLTVACESGREKVDIFVERDGLIIGSSCLEWSLIHRSIYLLLDEVVGASLV